MLSDLAIDALLASASTIAAALGTHLRTVVYCLLQYLGTKVYITVSAYLVPCTVPLSRIQVYEYKYLYIVASSKYDCTLYSLKKHIPQWVTRVTTMVNWSKFPLSLSCPF